MRKRITKRAVDTLRPRVGPDGKARPDFLWDTEVTGFGCKITAAGRKVYVFQYRTRSQVSKTPKRITLGAHGQLTPDQARKLAAKLLVTTRGGDDPAAAWQKRDAPIISALAARFLTEYLPGKKRPPRASTIKDYECLFRCHILPRLGRKRVEDVTSSDIERLHQAMRATPYQANRALTVLHQAFNQAERWQWRPQNSNPTVHIDRYPEKSRGSKKEVMLDPAQMATLFSAIDCEERTGTDPIACAAIRFTFWTGWRIESEVLRLRWDNLDLDLGRAKLIKTKKRAVEYRTLPFEAALVLRELPRIEDCPYVFPGRDAQSHLTTVKKPWAKIRKRAGLDKLEGLGAFRLHDFRHNVVSWDVSRGVPLKLAGKSVGHKSRQATEVYAHFAPDALKQVADERARAMREALEGSGQ